MKITVLAFLILFTIQSYAEYQLSHIRKIAVFPTAGSNTSFAEDAWWQSREILAKDQKFLVASRRFMINRGVFQARKSLKPADVIILSKILDAQALVTTWIEDRRLKMQVYEGSIGMLLWQSDYEFHPAISINDQLIKASTQLMNNFLTDIPYHGYQVIDPIIGLAVYEKNDKKFAQVFVGAQAVVPVGDPVQWMTAEGNLNSLKVTIVAEGTVLRQMNDKIEVEINKLKSVDDLFEGALVRLPNQLKKQQEERIGEEKGSNLTAEYLSTEIKNAEDFNKKTNPTVTALSYILNFAGFLLLAF